MPPGKPGIPRKHSRSSGESFARSGSIVCTQLSPFTSPALTSSSSQPSPHNPSPHPSHTTNQSHVSALRSEVHSRELLYRIRKPFKMKLQASLLLKLISQTHCWSDFRWDCSLPELMYSLSSGWRCAGHAPGSPSKWGDMRKTTQSPCYYKAYFPTGPKTTNRQTNIECDVSPEKLFKTWKQKQLQPQHCLTSCLIVICLPGIVLSNKVAPSTGGPLNGNY